MLGEPQQSFQILAIFAQTALSSWEHFFVSCFNPVMAAVAKMASGAIGEKSWEASKEDLAIDASGLGIRREELLVLIRTHSCPSRRETSGSCTWQLNAVAETSPSTHGR